MPGRWPQSYERWEERPTRCVGHGGNNAWWYDPNSVAIAAVSAPLTHHHPSLSPPSSQPAHTSSGPTEASYTTTNDARGSDGHDLDARSAVSHPQFPAGHTRAESYNILQQFARMSLLSPHVRQQRVPAAARGQKAAWTETVDVRDGPTSTRTSRRATRQFTRAVHPDRGSFARREPRPLSFTSSQLTSLLSREGRKLQVWRRGDAGAEGCNNGTENYM